MFIKFQFMYLNNLKLVEGRFFCLKCLFAAYFAPRHSPYRSYANMVYFPLTRTALHEVQRRYTRARRRGE